MEFKAIIFAIANTIIIFAVLFLILRPTTLIVFKRTYRKDPKFWDDIIHRIREHEKNEVA